MNISVAFGFGARIRSASRFVAVRALDALLPPLCLLCDTPVAKPGGLCATCWSNMPFITAPRCARLGTPFSHDVGADALSPRAMTDPPVFDRARAVARYSGSARDLVLAFKFGRRRELAGPMGRWMSGAGAEIVTEQSLLIPVPLHRGRLWRRGFNQAADLARAVAVQSGAEFAPFVLHRRRRTRPQVGLDAAGRLKNTRGAFDVDSSNIPNVLGRSIVLVDDVYTTGSTVTACTRVLKRAGAASVDVLAFAIADPLDADRT